MSHETPIDLLHRLSSGKVSARRGLAASELKITVIGSSNVGKSSLVRREVLGHFDESFQSSSVSERLEDRVELQGEYVHLLLVDTVTQDKCTTAVSAQLYRNSHAILLCFDVSNPTSFAQVDQWCEDVEKHAPREALLLLIATKCDLQRKVSMAQVRKKAADIGVHLVETSAKTGQNVKALFALLAKQLAGEEQGRTLTQITTSVSPKFGPVAASAVDVSQVDESSSSTVFGSFQHLVPLRVTSLVSLFASSDQTPEPSTPRKAALPSESPGDEFSLAKVLLEHSNLRARSLAGGLRRRTSIPLPLSETVQEPIGHHEYRQCTLGCGAMLSSDSSNHEQEECWLRQIPCSLGCGKSFKLLDCMAHEREQCHLRTIDCACGSKVPSVKLAAHQNSYTNKALAHFTHEDALHFLIGVFPDESLEDVVQEKGMLKNLNGQKLGNPVLLRTEASRQALCRALQDYAALHSTVVGEYVPWDHPSHTNGDMGETRTGFSNFMGGRFRKYAPFPPTSLHTASFQRHSPPRNDTNHKMLSVEEVDAEMDFRGMWTSWVRDAQEAFEHSKSSEIAIPALENEGAREVLVPLALGSRTVAVKTIRFVDLQLNSESHIGSGSFGSVYLGRYRGALVAVKHLHFQDASERELLREAAVMTSVSAHPHVLRFLGVCLEKPNVCFISEALKMSVEDWLQIDKGNNVESLSEILRYAEEAASGLYHLHLEMVVHRDIAARNLLLDNGTPARVKVCDFGLARVLPSRKQARSPFSSEPLPGGGSLELSGPIRWMAPESLKPVDGLLQFSFASDVYSFAICIWEMLSRDIPMAYLAPHEVAIAVLIEDLRPPRARIRPQVETALKELFNQAKPTCTSRLVWLLEACWAKDPEQRPPMRDIVNELSRLRHDL